MSRKEYMEEKHKRHDRDAKKCPNTYMEIFLVKMLTIIPSASTLGVLSSVVL